MTLKAERVLLNIVFWGVVLITTLYSYETRNVWPILCFCAGFTFASVTKYAYAWWKKRQEPDEDPNDLL